MQQLSDNIEAKSREPGKKGAARRLRRSGYVPAVVYGPIREPQFLAIDPKAFVAQRQRFGRSHLYTITMADGGDVKGIIKQIDRDPFTRELIHVDFYAVDMAKPIKITCRLDLKGKAAGVTQGGSLRQILRRVELQGLPGRIPDYLEFDVSNLGLGQSAHLSDLQLPEGVTVTAAKDDAIAAVSEPAGDKKAAADEGEAS